MSWIEDWFGGGSTDKTTGPATDDMTSLGAKDTSSSLAAEPISAPDNSNWTWRDFAAGLARAGAAAGADNRYLSPGIALGAFGGGFTQGLRGSQDDTYKLMMQQRMQEAQARNLLAQAGLAGAETDTKRYELQSLKDWRQQWGASGDAANLTTPQRTIAGAAAPVAPVAGSFQDRLIGRESSGNPALQNAQGYSGLYQFGAPRLMDLGMYKPAASDFKNGQWTGQWGGQFSIPGAENIKTISDFLKSPDAQHTAFSSHMGDIDTKIKADGLDKFIGSDIGGTPVTLDGMRAAAHLGGYQGMKNYIMSGGRSNPGDANGTRLSSYMGGFASPSEGAVGSRSMMTPAQRQLADTTPVAPGSLAPTTTVPQRIPVAQEALPGSPADQVPVNNVPQSPLNQDQRTLVAGPGAPTASLPQMGTPAPPLPLMQPGPGTQGAPAMPGMPGQGAPSPAAGMDLRAVREAMPPYLQAMVAKAGPVAGMKIVEDFMSKGIGRSRLLTPAELEAYHFAPQSVVEATPKIGGGLPDFKVIQSGTPREPNYKIETELYKDFYGDKEIKDFAGSQTHLDSLTNLANKFIDKGDRSGTTTAAMIIEMGKILDPSQVVRQTEADRLESQSLNPTIQRLMNGWNTNKGASLDAAGVRDLVRVANETHNGRLPTVQATADFFRQRAESAGVNADNVVNPRIFPRAGATGAATPASTSAPSTPAPAPTSQPPARPQMAPPPALTADWANRFKKPEDFATALPAVETPTLKAITDDEFKKMSAKQQQVLLDELERRRKAML